MSGAGSRQRLRLAPADVEPPVADVLRLQGIPPDTTPAEPLRALLERTYARLRERIAPTGLFLPLPVEEFTTVFRGEGHNEAEAPLANVFPRADALALFAVTLGPAVTDEIRDLFAAREFALGSLLDAAASEAAEQAAGVIERRFADGLTAAGRPAASTRRYSPGYCGWHLTAQRALFACLRPDDLGLTLRESCLMDPLKSISGVIVAGPPEIHEFAATFPFCAACAAQTCRAGQPPEC